MKSICVRIHIINISQQSIKNWCLSFGLPLATFLKTEFGIKNIYIFLVSFTCNLSRKRILWIFDLKSEIVPLAILVKKNVMKF